MKENTSHCSFWVTLDVHAHVIIIIIHIPNCQETNTLVSFAISALPRPPTSLIVTETTATRVTLPWDSGNPEPISYYVIQYPGQKCQTTASRKWTEWPPPAIASVGLSPYSEYEFRVMAVNNIGPWAAQRDGGDHAPVNRPPRLLRSSVQGPDAERPTMLVQWEPPEEPNGQIRGYRVYYTSDMHFPLSAWQKHNNEDSSLTTISAWYLTSRTASACWRSPLGETGRPQTYCRLKHSKEGDMSPCTYCSTKSTDIHISGILCISYTLFSVYIIIIN